MAISIWYYRKQTGKIEKVDEVSKADAMFTTRQYQIAFNCAFGNAFYNKDYVWAGLKRDCPAKRG